MLFCANCNSEIKERYCPKCGTEMERKDLTDPSTSVETVEPAMKLHAFALMAFVFGAIALGVSFTQLWWGTWGSVTLYFVVALLLVGAGVFFQVWSGKPRRESKNRVSSETNRIRPRKVLYSDRETTPLKWHKLFCYVVQPLFILILLTITIFAYASLIKSNISILTIGPTILFIQNIIAIMMLAGLLRFHRYGYVLIFVNSLLYILSSLSVELSNGFTAESFTQISGLLIFWIPNIIYYRKRRLLFT